MRHRRPKRPTLPVETLLLERTETLVRSIPMSASHAHDEPAVDGGHGGSPRIEYVYEARPADDDERDRWLEDAEHLPFTHVVRFQPCFTIRVKLPPWVDADAWLAEASIGWNGELTDAGEHWTEPGGYAWLEIDNDGSSQGIVEVARGDLDSAVGTA
jgi:hypothetical protein